MNVPPPCNRLPSGKASWSGTLRYARAQVAWLLRCGALLAAACLPILGREPLPGDQVLAVSTPADPDGLPEAAGLFAVELLLLPPVEEEPLLPGEEDALLPGEEEALLPDVGEPLWPAEGERLLPGSVVRLPREGLVLATWMPGKAVDLGFTEWDGRLRQGWSLPQASSKFFLAPSFRLLTLAGPQSKELASPLYAFSLSAEWLMQLNEAWTISARISPGFFSDLVNTGNDAWRLRGGLTGTWQFHPHWGLQLGAAYLDRNDIALLPVGGLIWTPNAETRLELILPRPRYAYRVNQNSRGPLGGDHWAYVAGEFGGGSWAIEREAAVPDVATLRDLRLLFGVETIGAHGVNWRVEMGYVFERAIEFQSGLPNIEPADTLLFRAGMSF
ncbi:hypothetical protein [Lignipirellula cremea]|uniref:hypothetical protein n=1 Tax=Lignipirellula cremea TaxID=2528010 RepID=UPI0011A46F43|nr:hypothetical protein [Lignipirellula cremea]